MSVTVIPIGTRLTLRLNTGLDENFHPIFRNRSWSNIKPGATDENVHAIGEQLASLQVHTLDSIRRVNENELGNE